MAHLHVASRRVMMGEASFRGRPAVVLTAISGNWWPGGPVQAFIVLDAPAVGGQQRDALAQSWRTAAERHHAVGQLSARRLARLALTSATRGWA